MGVHSSAEGGASIPGQTEAVAGARRIEVIGDCTLYLGDCREIMPTLGMVDAVVTDPPYNVTEKNGRDGTTVGRDSKGREVRKNFGDWDRGFDPSWLIESASKLLRERGNFVAFASDMLVSDYTRGALKHMRTMVWRKSNPQGSFNANYVPAFEWLVWCSKTAPGIYTGSRARFPEFHYPIVSADREHPTQKPLALMAELLDLHTASGEMVLDPFMGSGTTGVACVNLGRAFIGIERDPHFFDSACRRIEAADRQPRLFAEPPPRVVQGSLLDDAA